MKFISLSEIGENEIFRFSHLFEGVNYTFCDPTLSFVCMDDDNKLYGFALARRNNIDLSHRFSDDIGISADMVGCEILQVYAVSIDIELSLLKRLLQRVAIWCYEEDNTFDYLWAASLPNYDFYLDGLDCKKVKQYISPCEIKTIIYNKL